MLAAPSPSDQGSRRTAVVMAASLLVLVLLLVEAVVIGLLALQHVGGDLGRRHRLVRDVLVFGDGAQLEAAIPDRVAVVLQVQVGAAVGQPAASAAQQLHL